MFKKIKNKKGVTLVELLAVVVIMGIVAAIAVPTIGGLIETQRNNAAKESFNQVVEAAKLYATGQVGSGTTVTVSIATLETENYIQFDTTLYPLISGATLAGGSPVTEAGVNIIVNKTTNAVTFDFSATAGHFLFVRGNQVATDVNP